MYKYYLAQIKNLTCTQNLVCKGIYKMVHSERQENLQAGKAETLEKGVHGFSH